MMLTDTNSEAWRGDLLAKIWLKEPGELSLQRVAHAISSAQFRAFSDATHNQLRFGIGEGLPGLVWHSASGLSKIGVGEFGLNPNRGRAVASISALKKSRSNQR